MNTFGPTSRKDWRFDPNAIGNLILWNDASRYTAAPGASWSNNAVIFSSGVNAPYVTSTSATATYVNAATAGLNFGVFSFTTTDNYRVAPDPRLNTFSLFFLTKVTSATGRLFQGSAPLLCNILYGYWSGSKNSIWINGNPNNLTPAGKDSAWDLYSLRISEYSNINWDRFGSNIASYGTYTPPAMAGLAANGWAAFNEPSAFQIAEVLLYNTALSWQDARAVEGYLAWKWGLQANLPTSHPFYSNAPFLERFDPSIFPVSPRLWVDMADGTILKQTNGNTVRLLADKGSAGVLISSATGLNGDTFLPSTNIDSLNGYSTLTYQQSQSMWTYPFAASSNQKAWYQVAKTNSNILTNWAAVGQTWTLAPTEFFDTWASENNGGAAATPGSDVNSTTRIVSYGTGPSGVAVNVYAQLGTAQISFPSSQVWYLTSVTDAQNRGENANRIWYFSACNATSNVLTRPGGQYYTSTNLTLNVINAYRADANPWTIKVSYSLNSAHHSGQSMAEILFFDGALNLNDDYKVLGYLSWKWGLTANISSTYFTYKYIPPAIPSGFNGSRSNYFGTAQALTYLPLQSDLVDIGTWPQFIQSNGTITFGTVGAKTGATGFNTGPSWISFTNLKQMPFAMCMWYYNTNNTAYNSFLSYGISTISAATIEFNCNSNSATNTLNVLVASANTTNQNYNISTAAAYGNATTWYCIGLNFSTNTTTMYLNGTISTTITGTYPIHSRANTIFLGRSALGAIAGAGAGATGYIRHFALFDRQLTGTEMNTFFTNTA